ncbi:hypothetical protein C3L33_22965, partial [Rhododendron williamsianum]
MVDYQWFSNKDIFAARDMEYVPAVLDWALNGTCNMSESFCGANAHCLYNDNTSWNPECFCDKGYEGNPYLPSGSDVKTRIPRGLRFINASIRSIYPNNLPYGCKYAFMVDYQWFNDKDIFNEVRETEYVPAVLDWVYSKNTTCNTSGSFCGANAYCLDNAHTSWSPECFCDKGYEGNPYLPSGCQGKVFLFLVLFAY